MDFTAFTTRSAGMMQLLGRGVLALAAVFLGACSSSAPRSEIVVSVKDQKLGLYDQGVLRKEYDISTSKFGIGDQPKSYRTPLGKHEVIDKIGHGLPTGEVLNSRSWNGEVLKPNAPGRDPIVSRILWLRGMENSNRNAMRRFIYIHGTTEESRLGKPASYGCIRMGMKDVVDLFNDVGIGAKVVITRSGLPAGAKPPRVEEAEPEAMVAEKSDQPASLEAPSPATNPATAEVAPKKGELKTDSKTDNASKEQPVAKGKSKKTSPKGDKPTTGNVVSRNHHPAAA